MAMERSRCRRGVADSYAYVAYMSVGVMRESTQEPHFHTRLLRSGHPSDHCYVHGIVTVLFPFFAALIAIHPSFGRNFPLVNISPVGQTFIAYCFLSRRICFFCLVYGPPSG